MSDVVQISFRISPRLKKQLDNVAEMYQLSLNQLGNEVLEQFVKNEKL